MIIKDILVFCTLSWIWLDPRRWNQLWNNNTFCLSYTANTMSDALAPKDTSASAGMVLSPKSQNIPSPASEDAVDGIFKSKCTIGVCKRNLPENDLYWCPTLPIPNSIHSYTIGSFWWPMQFLNDLPNKRVICHHCEGWCSLIQGRMSC